jgi:4-hydroxybenzoate polyprenyltransferase
MYAWRLVRGTNLLLLLGSLCLLLYQAGIELPFFSQLTLLIGTGCIAAAGNIMNDIVDQEIDQINRVKRRTVGVVFSERSVWRAYYGLNILALCMAVAAGNWGLLGCFCLFVGLLWGYSSRWKCRPWVGNLTIAFLCALSLLQLLLLEPTQWSWYWRIGVSIYASFAFLTNWLRELVKDIEDEQGDGAQGCSTLVVVRGIPYSLRIAVSICNALLLWLVLQVALLWNYRLWLAFIYSSCVLVPVALWVRYRLKQVLDRKKIRQLSQLLKGYMLLGLIGFLCL